MNKEILKWLNSVIGVRRNKVVLLVILQALLGCFSVSYAFLFKGLVDSATKLQEAAFTRYALCLLILLVLQIGIQAINRYQNEKTKAEIENGLKSHFFRNLLGKEYKDISDLHSGKWLIRLSSDTRIVSNEVVGIVPGLVSMIVRIIGIVISLIIMDQRVTVVLFFGGISLFLLTLYFRKKLKQYHKDIQEKDGTLRAFIQEQIENILLIKAYGKEEMSADAADAFMEEHKEARLKRVRFSALGNVGFSTVMHGAYILTGIYCGHRLMNQSISYGTLVAMMQLVSQIQSPFANISGYIPRYYSLLASAERLRDADLLKDEEDSLDRETLHAFYKNQLVSFGFKDMSFSYENEREGLVVKHCNIEIRKGDFVAIVGASGCGKSTLLKLLLSLYPINSGQRYLKTKDGMMDLDQKYRGLFAYVPQMNLLMSGTIREAVTFNSSNFDEELFEKALYLSDSDAFVAGLAEKENTLLKERGGGLSEGQLQRLMIARAIYSGREILLLDEATSALDSETMQELLQRIRTLTDMSVILVTHSQTALAYFDKVIECRETEGELLWKEK